MKLGLTLQAIWKRWHIYFIFILPLFKDSLFPPGCFVPAGDRDELRPAAVHALPSGREHWLVSGYSQNAPQEEDALGASFPGPSPAQRARPPRPGKVRNVLWTASAHMCHMTGQRERVVVSFFLLVLLESSAKSLKTSRPELTGAYTSSGRLCSVVAVHVHADTCFWKKRNS